MTVLKGLLIPHGQLTREALDGLIEEFVTRDGTDYGRIEASLASKMDQIRTQLEKNEAVIVFDPASQTCNILPAGHPAVRALKE